MPPVNRYECNRCDFAFPEGWGGHLYLIDDAGDRAIVGHPCEASRIERVLGPMPDPDVVRERTGYNSYCVCLDCVAQFELDLGDEIVNPYREFYAQHGLYLGRRRRPAGCLWLLRVRDRVPCGTTQGRDERKCPQCGSLRVRTCFEMIDHPCPKCKDGFVVELVTGRWA
jgi:hypothetical protein